MIDRATTASRRVLKSRLGSILGSRLAMATVVAATLLSAPAAAQEVKTAEAAVRAVAQGSLTEQMAARAQLARALRRAGQDAKANTQWRAVLAAFDKGNFSRNGSTEAQLAAEAVFWLGRAKLPAKVTLAAVGKRGERSLTEVLTTATTAARAQLLGKTTGTATGAGAADGPLGQFQAEVDRYASPAWSLAAATVQADALAELAEQVRGLVGPAGLSAADALVWTDLCTALAQQLEAEAVTRLRPRWDDVERRGVDTPWIAPAKLALSRLAPADFALSRLRQTEWLGGAPADPAALAPLLLQVRVCYDQHLGSGVDDVLSEVRLKGLISDAGRVGQLEAVHDSKRVVACIQRRAAGLTGLPAGTAFEVRLELAAL